MSDTAEKHEVPEIAAADALAIAASSNSDIEELVHATYRLMDLCRSTQHAYVELHPEIDTNRRQAVK